MARTRFVKPELFRHEGLFEAECRHQLPLRLAFVGLFTCCDREGRFRWQPNHLKQDIFPRDSIDMANILDALVMNGFIEKYKHRGECYGCIPSWLRHQHIHELEVQSEIPAPPGWSVSKPLKAVTKDADGPTALASKMPAHVGSASLMDKQIQMVFEHWKSVMGHPEAKLDPKRRILISKSLNLGYRVEHLCQAITGCSAIPYNMGNNDQGQRYDGLHVILRDADQIDRFIYHYYYPPKPIRAADKHTLSNVQTLQRWMDQKMQEEAKKDPAH